MIYHPPFLPYCGLTIILSKPARIDQVTLLSGYPGSVFDKTILPFSRFNCDVRIIGEPTPLLPNTRVVLLLGEPAKRSIPKLNSLTLNECRGYIYPYQGILYICSYGLEDSFDRKKYETEGEDTGEADIENLEEGTGKDHSKTRRRNFKFWLLNDIRKCVDILLNGYYPQVEIEYKVYPNIEEIIQLLENTRHANIYLDIETNRNFNITVISFCVDNTRVITVPIYRYDGRLAYEQVKIGRFFRALDRAFSNNNIIIHNASFDLFILAWRYRVIPPPISKIEDTMLMQHRLYPESEKSLGHCISLYSHDEFHKNEGVWEPKNSEQEQSLWKYNAKDVARLIVVHKGIIAEGIKSNLFSSFERANKLIRPFLLQSLHGIAIDRQYLNDELTEQLALKEQYLRIMRLLTNLEWPLVSPQRIAKYLYHYNHFPKPPPSYINGLPHYDELTSAGTLYKLAIKHHIPFLDILFRYRHAEKKAGFLAFSGWSHIDNQYASAYSSDRFTFSMKIAGTDTYRLASSKLFGQKKTYEGTEKFNGWGSNVQNIEKKLRKVLKADNGKILVQSDQSGAEALIVAYIAPKGRYRQLFENGIKVHSYIAMHIFQREWEKELGRSISHLITCDIPNLKLQEDWKLLAKLIASSDDWPPSRRYYYIAKMVCHASAYGMRAPTFVLNVLKKSEGVIQLSTKDANTFLEAYHALFPEIKQWHLAVINTLDKSRTLYNLFGDRRVFNGYWDDTMHRAGFAFIPQSTVGMLTNIAISEIQQEIDNHNPEYDGIDVLLNCHDAIVSQCRMGDERKLAMIQERHLGKTFLANTPDQFSMKSESTYGFNWYELQKFK